jgi:hypothetical protein
MNIHDAEGASNNVLILKQMDTKHKVYSWGGLRGGFRESADPQLIFVNKIGLLEIFFSF